MFPLLVGVGLIAALLAGAYLLKLQADSRSVFGSGDLAAPATKVAAVALHRTSEPVVIRVRGFLEGMAEVRVPAEVAGRVSACPVADGQSVDQGEVLCRVEDTFHRIALAEAEANVRVAGSNLDRAKSLVEAAGAELERVQAQRDNARVEFERLERLFAAGNAPRIEYDRLEVGLRTAEAAARAAAAALRQATQERDSAEAAVALADAGRQRARETLDRCAIRAPLAGVVDRLLVEEGEYLTAAQPVADVIRLDRLKLLVELSGRQLAALGGQGRAEVVADARPDRVYAAELHHVAPRADRVSRKFRVELHVDNPGGELLAGMFASCSLTVAEAHQAMLAPASAFVRRFGRDACYVLVEAEGQTRCELRWVETRSVPHRLDVVEVVEGLGPGDRIVVDSHEELRDGQPVAPTMVRSE